MFNQIIKSAQSNPKVLFLIDGAGAIISAFFLGVVLVKMEKYFGIPSSTLYFLATLPVIFAVYDAYSYLKGNKLSYSFKLIALMNLSYCIISIGFILYHFKTMTILGHFYIIIELLIVISLAIIEFKVANRLVKCNK